MNSYSKLTNASSPIGIFDSGLGGLTVVKAIRELLPAENIVYFGDTAHTPWGDKSAAVIQAFSIKITELLLSHQVKCIVIACNTASSVAFELIREYVKENLVINVIDPAVDFIATNMATSTIGLIGTKQTIRSLAYSKRLTTSAPQVKLKALPTPLLVPLIEEGFSIKHEYLMETVLKEYLAESFYKDIEALILGCTHYPLIKQHLTKLLPQVTLIDSAHLTAMRVQQELHKQNLLCTTKNPGNGTFYVSDVNDFFETVAKLFLGTKINLELYQLW